MSIFENLIKEEVAARELEDLITGNGVSNAIDILIDSESKKADKPIKGNIFHVPDEIIGLEIIDGAFDPSELKDILISGLSNIEQELQKSEEEAIPVEFTDEEEKDIKDCVYGTDEDSEVTELEDDIRGTDEVLKSMEEE